MCYRWNERGDFGDKRRDNIMPDKGRNSCLQLYLFSVALSRLNSCMKTEEKCSFVIPYFLNLYLIGFGECWTQRRKMRRERHKDIQRRYWPWALNKSHIWLTWPEVLRATCLPGRVITLSAVRKAGQLLSCSWCHCQHPRVNFSAGTLGWSDTCVQVLSPGCLLKDCCRVCLAFCSLGISSSSPTSRKGRLPPRPDSRPTRYWCSHLLMWVSPYSNS